VLFETGLTPRRLTPGEYVELPTFGIGLTDVAKDQAGSDAAIDLCRSSPGRVREQVKRFAPGILAFNGKKAAQLFLDQRHVNFGLQAARVGTTRLFVAPSTSGAASGYWDLEVWHELANLARDLAM